MDGQERDSISLFTLGNADDGRCKREKGRLNLESVYYTPHGDLSTLFLKPMIIPSIFSLSFLLFALSSFSFCFFFKLFFLDIWRNGRE